MPLAFTAQNLDPQKNHTDYECIHQKDQTRILIYPSPNNFPILC